MTGLPEAFACCGDVTRGLARTMAGADFPIALVKTPKTCTFSLFHLQHVDELVQLQRAASSG